MASQPNTEHRTDDAHGECGHRPCCPAASAPDRDAALVVSSHPEQGWSLLCNGVVSFDDAGDLLPDGQAIPPQRSTGHASAA
jgi:Family of unknown function (DUF5999)